MKWIDSKTYGIYYFGIFLFFMVIRWVDGLMLFQLANNPIRSPRIDPIVWFFQNTNIPDFFSLSSFSYVVDLSIIILPAIILYRLIKQKPVHKLALLHFLLFGFYVLLIYTYPTLSIRKYLGLLLIPVAFSFRKNERYVSYLELLRYYVCFLFVSASLWKLVRGVAFDTVHMQLSLKAQHIDNFVNWPDHFITKMIRLFIDNPQFCMALMGMAVITQLSFSIGFITKKYDRLLAILLLIFIISDYLVMRIEYWEFIVFLPLFLGKRIVEPKLESAKT